MKIKQIKLWFVFTIMQKVFCHGFLNPDLWTAGLGGRWLLNGNSL